MNAVDRLHIKVRLGESEFEGEGAAVLVTSAYHGFLHTIGKPVPKEEPQERPQADPSEGEREQLRKVAEQSGPRIVEPVRSAVTVSEEEPTDEQEQPAPEEPANLKHGGDYCAAQLDYLRKAWPDPALSREEIAKVLGRPLVGVRNKANKMGLKRPAGRRPAPRAVASNPFAPKKPEQSSNGKGKAPSPTERAPVVAVKPTKRINDAERVPSHVAQKVERRCPNCYSVFKTDRVDEVLCQHCRERGAAPGGEG